MPHKLKTSARKSRRNKKIGIVTGVALLAILVIAAVYVFGRSSPTSIPVVQGKVLLQTSMGNITIELRDDMPITTSNFKNLVTTGVYDNTIFHRVINNTSPYMIQGGDPTGTGYGDPSIPNIKDEFTTNNHNDRGTIAMANTGQPDSGSSQFFINTANNSYLDTKHPVFGKVIEGMDVVDAISNVARDANDKPLTDVKIVKAEILP